MNPHQGRDASRPIEPVTPAILAGRAWTARLLRNNCLRQHAHALARCFRRRDLAPMKAVCARLCAALEQRSNVFFHLHPNELAIVPMLTRLCAYHSCWIRQPEDWQPVGEDAYAQWSHFLHHLLARYPVPAFLDAAWLAKGNLVHFERDCWCALASGRSLRSVPGFPRSAPGHVLHRALTKTKLGSLSEAIWQAQLSELRVGPALSEAVLSSRVAQELGRHAWWLRLVSKFAATGDEHAGVFALCADALNAIENHRSPAHAAQLLRLPLGDLIRHCSAFVTKLLNAHGHLLTKAQVRAAAERRELSRLAESRWRPMLHNESPHTIHGDHWRIVELCSHEELQAEGKAMRHCVARYAGRCHKGDSAIFSLRHQRGTDDAWDSFATIEVHPRTNRIVQVRARANHPINSTPARMIRMWAGECGLAL
ncbi:MAG: PcfJ domain-containing protein [Verrucomicrobiaceae bacterium]|nr:PcfJ domain-containing protein [Verrucomicrobiaceae bacterium]